MMKPLLIYWVIGCAIVGLPAGMLMNDCPGVKISSADMLATITIWPMIIFAAFTHDRIAHPIQLECAHFDQTSG